MADISFTFTGDASSLKKAFDDIKAELANTRNAVAGLSTQFANAYIAVKGAVEAIKGAFQAISTIPEQAARIEDLNTVFASLMGNAAQASALLDDLWHDAANGAVGLEELAAAAKPLTTVFASNKAIREWSNRFADISAGSGIAADALAKVYSRALTLGRVDSRSVDALAKKGLPVYQELAEVIGVAADEVQQMVKKGEVSADQYSAALRRMTDEGGRYYKLSSQLSETSKGSWNTMLENVNRVAAALGKPINEAVTPLLQRIAAYLEASMPRVQEFGRELVNGFTAVAEVLAPFVKGVGALVNMLGGAKTAIASVAAGLIMFSGNSTAAAASTFSLRAAVASLVNVLRGLSLSTFKAAFQSVFTSMKATFTATLTSMRAVWGVAWSTMAAVVRASMLAVKTALISTGVGLIIVGIGEALGALYSWFMGNANAAKEAAASAREFARALEGLERQAGKVKTQEQYDAFMEELQDRIDGLQGQRDDAAAEGEDERAEQLAAQVDELEEQRARYQRILPMQIQAVQEEQKRTEELRRQAEEAAELEKKLEDARKRMSDLVAKQHEHGREAFLSGLGDTKAEIDIRLSDAGFKTIEDLEREIARLEKLGGKFKLGDEARYEKLCAVYNKLIDLKHKDAEETRKAEEEERKRDAEAAKRRQEVALNQQEYDMKIKILRAEISGNEQKLQILKAQQRITELTLQYQREGLADAEAAAKRMVALEMQAEDHRSRRDNANTGRGRDSGTRISSSLASVGGGGRSILIGGPLVTETKKHTKLLEAIKVATGKTPTVKVSGNVEAVIGR